MFNRLKCFFGFHSWEESYEIGRFTLNIKACKRCGKINTDIYSLAFEIMDKRIDAFHEKLEKLNEQDRKILLEYIESRKDLI